MASFHSSSIEASTLLLLALSLAACGDSGTTTTTGAGGAGTTSSATSGSTTTTSSSKSATSTTGAGMMCPGMGFSGMPTAQVGGSATAKVVDQTGAAVPNQPIYICGTDICSSPGMTDASGNASISTTLMEKKPAFKFGDRVLYSELGIPLTMMTTAVGTVATAKLPATGAPFTAGGNVTNGGVTLAVPANDNLGFDVLLYDTADKQAFKAVQVPLTNLTAVLPAMTPAFEIFYGVSPSETTMCPAVGVTVPNTPNWPAGTKVEFWVMTLDAGEEFAPYAGWAKASDGTVSGDGMTVSTDSGAGFIYLDNFAVRKKS